MLRASTGASTFLFRKGKRVNIQIAKNDSHINSTIALRHMFESSHFPASETTRCISNRNASGAGGDTSKDALLHDFEGDPAFVLAHFQNCRALKDSPSHYKIKFR